MSSYGKLRLGDEGRERVAHSSMFSGPHSVINNHFIPHCLQRNTTIYYLLIFSSVTFPLITRSIIYRTISNKNKFHSNYHPPFKDNEYMSLYECYQRILSFLQLPQLDMGASMSVSLKRRNIPTGKFQILLCICVHGMLSSYIIPTACATLVEFNL